MPLRLEEDDQQRCLYDHCLTMKTHKPNTAALSLLAMLLFSCATQAETRPNILVLMAEDMSARVGSFGDSIAQTPNIDKLAAEGIRYTQTFTTAGVCAPSRAAFITGMHQISFGAQHMRTATRPAGAYKTVPPAEVKAFPEYLRQHGYYTFTDRKLDYQFSGPFADTGPFSIWDAEGADVDWSERDPDQPFFGLINFLITHESGVFPPLGHWPNSRTHLTMQVMRWLASGSVDQVTKPEDIVLEPYYPDTPTVRTDIARHYDNIRAMDQQVGEIIQRLREEGLLENTIIIWTTDHGDGLPRAKRELYDSGIHVPMIIRWPDGRGSGSEDHRLVSFVDLAPTLMSLARVPIPSHLQGQNLLATADRAAVYASRDRIDSVMDRRRAVRTERYKYIRSWFPTTPTGHPLDFRDNVPMVRELFELYADDKLSHTQRLWFEATGAEQLFDLEADPHELNNLAENNAYRDQLIHHRTLLDTWLQEVGDTSAIEEDEMVRHMHPGDEAHSTPPPKAQIIQGKLTLTPPVEGASLGYRFNDERWRLYTEPVHVPSGASISVKAVRYGWEESDEIQLTSP